MTTYYTTAKAHGGKYLKIPIEAKHVYKNTPSPNQVLVDNYGGSDSAGGTFRNGFRATSATPIILYDTTNDPWKWTQGSGPQDAIGDKIMVKSVNFHFEFSLRKDAFIYSPEADLTFEAGHNQTTQNPIMINDSQSNESFQAIKNNSWRRDYRLQVIHFEQDLPASQYLQAFVAKWFSTTYVPQKYETGGGSAWDEYGYTRLMSNKVEMLRESTPYTGKFKKIYETSFSLNQNKTYQIIDFQLDPKKQVNLVPDSNEKLNISNDWWLNTVVILWQPMNYDMDMDPLSAGALKTINSSSYSAFTIGDITKSIKLTYYDV